jgi:hypothetical protein
VPIQRTTTRLRYVNCGPGHIQWNYTSTYSFLNYSTKRSCVAIGDISTMQCALHCKLCAKYSAQPPDFAMCTVVPAIYSVITAQHIQDSIYSWTCLRRYWTYNDNSMRLILQTSCQYSAQPPDYAMWTVVRAIYSEITPPHIHSSIIQLNVAPLLLEIFRQFSECYTANMVPNTAHNLQISLCALWSRPYTV